MRYLTDRKRAVGSGAGSEGTQHHWKMMVSSISLAVIAPFFIFTFGAGLGGTYEEVLAYFSRPFVVLVMALGLLVGLNHFKMEIDEAIEDLDAALAITPNSVDALQMRARAHLAMDALDKAEADMNRALLLDGRNIDTLVLRGDVIEARRLAGG